MIKEILKEAFVLKTNGYYKNAIECFYKALGQDSSSIEILYELAECYYLINEEERALSYLEQVLDRTSTHINSLNLLKKIFVDKKAWAEAEQAAKNIYCITQDLNDLAKILELLNKQGRYEEIFEYKTEGISSNILYEKAYAKYCTNDYNNAEIFINEALTSSKDEKLYLLKGKILYKTNRLEECIELLPHIEVNKNSDVLNYVGLIKQYECKFGEALELFLEAVRLSPKVSEYYYNCASTYFKMENLQQAKKYYNLAISLEPENLNYHFALANLYYSEKHYRRAMEELKGDFFEANLLKSIILFDTGYFALAKKEFDKLLLEQPENELIINYKNKIDEKFAFN